MNKITLDKENNFKVLIVSTMSSGKSTLINALIGQNLLHSANEATTSLITEIQHCSQENFSAYISFNEQSENAEINTREYYIDNVNRDLLKQWNKNPAINHIKVKGCLANFSHQEHHWSIIDTPGVNNSQDYRHQKITQDYLDNGDYNLLIYILNATQLGINDDYLLLKNIKNILSKRCDKNIVFVLNKIDVIDEEKESLLDMLNNANLYLKRLGFTKPIIISTSAVNALNLRRIINGDKITYYDKVSLLSHLAEPTKSVFKYYLNLPVGLLETFDSKLEITTDQTKSFSVGTKRNISYKELAKALVNSGIPLLEHLISYYINLEKNIIKPTNIGENLMNPHKIFIEHNPFTIQTTFKVDGHDIAENSELDQYKNQRLQHWIDHLFEALYRELNGQTSFNIHFKGTTTDCADMQLAVENAKEQGMDIELQCTEVDGGEQRLNKIQELMEQAKNDPIFSSYIADNPQVKEDFEEAINRDFDVYVVATMSSGKSTLINAMLGCGVLPALNEATTATIASIKDNDSMERGYFIANRIDKNGKYLSQNTNLCFTTKTEADESLEILSNWNKDKETHQINIEGNIVGITERDNVRLVLTDTPGPNNSQDQTHNLATMRHIRDSKRNPLILYVLNGTQLGINDDRSLLQDIAEIMHKEGKQNRDRFIFVVNKADVFDPEKGENIEGVVERAKTYLENNGIQNPVVYPVSAYLTGLLRKHALNEDLLTRLERADMNGKIDLFKEEATMDLVQYMPLSPQVKMDLDKKNYPIALYRSGLPAVEAMIDDYINKYNLPHRVNRAYEALKRIIEDSSNKEKIKASLNQNQGELEKLAQSIGVLEQKRKEGFTSEGYIEQLKQQERGISNTVAKSLLTQESKTRQLINQWQDKFKGKVKPNEAEKLLDSFTKDIKHEYNRTILDLEELIEMDQDTVKQELANDYHRFVERLFSEVESLNLSVLTGIKHQVNAFNFNTISKIQKDEINIEMEKTDEWVSTSTWWNIFSWGDGYYKEIKKEYIDLEQVWDNRSSEVINAFNSLMRSAKAKVLENGEQLVEQFILFFNAQFDQRFNQLLEDYKETIKNSANLKQAIAEAKNKLMVIQNFEQELDKIIEL